MVPKKHHSKSKAGRRRAHLALSGVRVTKHSMSGAPRLSHRACRFTDEYEGQSAKKSIDVAKEKEPQKK